MALNTKTTVLRYCHVVGHNVYMELDQNNEGDAGADSECPVRCLNRQLCSKERGGCSNVLINNGNGSGSF